jgi:hypothetical protein
MYTRYSKFLFALLVFGGTQVFAPPKSPENFIEISDTLRTIPYGAVVEGSAHFGGIQPDYVVDVDVPEVQRILRYGDRLKKEKISVWEKIDRVTKYMQKRVLPKTDYDDPDYLELVARYRAEGKEIPLSAYIKCGAGVCREYSILTHLILNRAGIPSRHAYAEIRRRSDYYGYDITEDHGFTVVKIRGKDWVVDPYYWGFHGFLLSDLVSPEGITEESKASPIATPAPGFRRIIQLHDFPRMWISTNNACDSLKKLAQ